MERVLIANRGVIARRLVRGFAARGVETVAVFSEPDVEQPYVDEADYAVYLNGQTVAETYLDVQRIVAAGMDAACDALHPGTCFLADSPELVEASNRANLQFIGPSRQVVATATDRLQLRRLCREMGIPLVPASATLEPEDDGVAIAAQMGVPLLVRSARGKQHRRVDALGEVAAANR